MFATMEPSSNRYALAALRERRAELAGELAEVESRARHIRESIGHVDGALRLFDPDADPSTIAHKRPYRRVKLFGHGKLNRLVLDALRAGGRPMTCKASGVDVYQRQLATCFVESEDINAWMVRRRMGAFVRPIRPHL